MSSPPVEKDAVTRKDLADVVAAVEANGCAIKANHDAIKALDAKLGGKLDLLLDHFGIKGKDGPPYPPISQVGNVTNPHG